MYYNALPLYSFSGSFPCLDNPKWHSCILQFSHSHYRTVLCFCCVVVRHIYVDNYMCGLYSVVAFMVVQGRALPHYSHLCAFLELVVLIQVFCKYVINYFYTRGHINSTFITTFLHNFVMTCCNPFKQGKFVSALKEHFQ